jgi:hypothetical protein
MSRRDSSRRPASVPGIGQPERCQPRPCRPLEAPSPGWKPPALWRRLAVCRTTSRSRQAGGVDDRADPRAVVAASIAASLGTASAAVSAYWGPWRHGIARHRRGRDRGWGRQRSAGVVIARRKCRRRVRRDRTPRSGKRSSQHPRRFLPQSNQLSPRRGAHQLNETGPAGHGDTAVAGCRGLRRRAQHRARRAGLRRGCEGPSRIRAGSDREKRPGARSTCCRSAYGARASDSNASTKAATRRVSGGSRRGAQPTSSSSMTSICRWSVRKSSTQPRN